MRNKNRQQKRHKKRKEEEKKEEGNRRETKNNNVQYRMTMREIETDRGIVMPARLAIMFP